MTDQEERDFLIMASIKRFTDSKKWETIWFRSLSPKMRFVWLYLNDACDHAGIWETDFALLEMRTGIKTNQNEVTLAFKNKIKWLNSGHLYLLDFCAFQYGDHFLSSKSPCVLSALILLRKNKLIEPFDNPYQRVKEEEEEKDKVKGKEEEKEKGVFSQNSYSPVGHTVKHKGPRPNTLVTNGGIIPTHEDMSDEERKAKADKIKNLMKGIT